jgi:Protein of unknown function (DUF2281)
MRLAEKIAAHIENLPETYKAEVLDFVEFLESKSKQLRDGDEDDRALWSHYSLSQAMRGMEDEEVLYSLDDLVEVF